jgi:hypothetical protein
MREHIVDIQQQINAALAGRAGQRDFVDGLADNWNALAESFKTLASSAAELARASAVTHAPDLGHAKLFDSLGRYFATDSDWRKQAAALAGQLDAGTDLIGVLRERVHRETVNIGVIGVTGAGKSTLLRRLSGLTEEHIPSNKYVSSTATPSRIFNEPYGTEDRALLYLHTWPTFRDEVLQPLHDKAGLSAPAPASIDDFRRFPYPESAGEREAGAERFYRKLREARDSLPSYESMLGGGTERISLEELRPYVAYPADEKSRQRPYHAVRSVDIYCHFPRIGVVSLGLVDLPGSGEAGLDVHKRFLTDLKNSTDLVFIVKRPSRSPSTDQDWDARQLADDASAGVRRNDFARQVINRDQELQDDYFEQAEKRARADSAQLGIEVSVCDIEGSGPDEVIDAVLMPTLNHLAERLAYMDRDAVAFVLKGLAETADGVRSLSRDLNRQFGVWQESLPDADKRIRERFRKLKNQVGRELKVVCDEYDRLYETGQPIAELHEQIETAGREIREWLASGLGSGSREKWIDEFEDSIAGEDIGDELDRQYNRSRERVVEVFGKIDASLELAIERLHGEVAAALRRKLTENVVPAGPGNGAVLRQFADLTGSDARTLTSATERLLALRADYGSIFLRVGRPVVRRIKWYRDQPQVTTGGRLAADVAAQVLPQATSAATNIAVSQVAGPGPGQAAADAVHKAASSAMRRGGDQQNTGTSWLSDHLTSDHPTGVQTRAPRAPSPAPPPPPSQPADSGAERAGSAGRDQLSNPAYWYDRLTGTINSVTGELEQKFHDEAQQTLKVLAVAVDLFKDGTTTAPDIEVEYERVCLPFQQDIWPEDFGEGSAKIAAEMAALRQQVHNATAAADQVAVLAGQATRL